ncbi:hypothetical protein GCM10027280_12900 [Micromonospora polyrhachis]
MPSILPRRPGRRLAEIGPGCQEGSLLSLFAREDLLGLIERVKASLDMIECAFDCAHEDFTRVYHLPGEDRGGGGRPPGKCGHRRTACGPSGGGRVALNRLVDPVRCSVYPARRADPAEVAVRHGRES